MPLGPLFYRGLKQLKDEATMTEQQAKDESQQRATESGCGAVALWVGVFVAGIVVGYLLGEL